MHVFFILIDFNRKTPLFSIFYRNVSHCKTSFWLCLCDKNFCPNNSLPPKVPSTVAFTVPPTVHFIVPSTVPFTFPPTVPFTVSPTILPTVPLIVPPTIPRNVPFTVPPTITNNARMNNRTDLNRGKVVYYQSSFISQLLGLIY